MKDIFENLTIKSNKTIYFKNMFEKLELLNSYLKHIHTFLGKTDLEEINELDLNNVIIFLPKIYLNLFIYFLQEKIVLYELEHILKVTYVNDKNDMEKVIYNEQFNMLLIENDNIDLYDKYKNSLSKLFCIIYKKINDSDEKS